MFGRPTVPPIAPTLTILPPPAASIFGTTARTALSKVPALISSRNFQLSAVVSCTAGPMRKPPAMLHSASMRPNFWNAVSTALAVEVASRRSAASGRRRASAE